mgnify:CR=1 FL=1
MLKTESQKMIFLKNQKLQKQIKILQTATVTNLQTKNFTKKVNKNLQKDAP